VNGYWIAETRTISLVILFLLLSAVVGWLITLIRHRSLARTLAWLFTIGSVVLVERLTANEPSGTRMLVIIAALLWAMKSVVTVESGVRFSFIRWLCFAVGWFGMRPSLFREKNKNRSASNSLESKSFFVKGSLRIGTGAALICAAAFFWYRQPLAIEFWNVWSSTACLLLGFSFLVHFGIFSLLVGFWRSRGVRCDSLFKAPLYSSTLAEFWGKRWNLAFSEMTTLAVFRPIKKLMLGSAHGKTIAMVCAFAFSGLLHELAISVPVGAGNGLPLLYFLLHGIAMILEVQFAKAGFDLATRPVLGRVWTIAWLLLPLPLLFHRPFLEGCVWPIIGVV